MENADAVNVRKLPNFRLFSPQSMRVNAVLRHLLDEYLIDLLFLYWYNFT